jgi:hypothetical protein
MAIPEVEIGNAEIIAEFDVQLKRIRDAVMVSVGHVLDRGVVPNEVDMRAIFRRASEIRAQMCNNLDDFATFFEKAPPKVVETETAVSYPDEITGQKIFDEFDREFGLVRDSVMAAVGRVEREKSPQAVYAELFSRADTMSTRVIRTFKSYDPSSRRSAPASSSADDVDDLTGGPEIGVRF